MSNIPIVDFLPEAIEEFLWKICHNKAVLCFEGYINEKQACEWIELYNQEHTLLGIV